MSPPYASKSSTSPTRKQLGRHVIPALPLELLESGTALRLPADAKAVLEAEPSYGDRFPDVALLRVGDAPAAFTSRFTGGSCASNALFNVVHGDATALEVDDPDEELRWSWWGGGDYPAYIAGRHLVITADLLDRNLVRLVSSVTPQGRVQPLCSVKTEPMKSVGRSEDPKACTRIVNGSAESPKWQPIKMQLSRDQWDRVGRYADGVRIATIDLDGDGQTEDVGHFQYDSGAGCGSHAEWLLIVNRQRNGTVQNGLNDWLTRHAGGEEVKVWRLERKHYLETYRPGIGGAVYRFDRSGGKRVCELGWINKASVSKIWLR